MLYDDFGGLRLLCLTFRTIISFFAFTRLVSAMLDYLSRAVIGWVDGNDTFQRATRA
jgi:hypothetical protein